MATRIEKRELREIVDRKPQARPRLQRNELVRLLAFAKPYWVWLVVAAIAMIIGSVLGLALPAMAGGLIDTVFVKADRNGLNNIALILLLVFAFQAFFIFLQSYLLNNAGERIVNDLRVKLYSHLQTLSLGFFNERRTGELMSRLTNDVTMVQNAVTTNLISAAQSLLTLIGAIVMIVTRDWRMTLLILALIPILTAVAITVGKRIRFHSNEVQKYLGETTTILEETISNQKTVMAFTRESYEIGRYKSGIGQVYAAAMRRIRLQSGFVALITFLSFSAIIVVLWFGGQQVLDGHLTPGELVSILIYMGVVAGPIGTLTGLFSEFQKALGGAERIFNLLDEPASVTDLPDAKPLAQGSGNMRFEEVFFDYDERSSVLRGVSFEAKQGQVVALVGPSGAGKTTIANLIPRFYDPKMGRITLDGHDIRDVTLKSLREQIGIVPQEPVLFGTTVLQNIAYGRLEASRAEIEEAARGANAHQFIEKLPDGYETLVGERGVKLSGGQRQRIAIARAILRNPRILILDEATSSLDNESESLVQEALDRLMKDRTTIVIAHRLTTIEKANKIVVMDKGELVEEGTHADLIEREGLYYRLYTRNFQDD
ncbi:MAG: ABC transporter ATP-binding protein [Chloroflexi bacterium]|uniref:ABC transporter ATP-binding protein n=1 Tax=Candidatus Chlorohelix allophototropha TaxID=3003348 RepID=A0A8T7LY85_9CHLR|nr:ABC transporter ATP-binding protein [Chloroflexota bacterium]WJW67834.1 ABC transporter ATP-binding protein/permease [Chloroflexota bacterium L227-S17]